MRSGGRSARSSRCGRARGSRARTRCNELGGSRRTEPARLGGPPARRSRLDHDEGVGEGPRRSIWLRLRSRGRCPAASDQPAGPGRSAERALSFAQIRPASPIRRSRDRCCSSLSSITFAGVMAVQAKRIARERDRANREAQTAREVRRFWSDSSKYPNRARRRPTASPRGRYWIKAPIEFSRRPSSNRRSRRRCSPPWGTFTRVWVSIQRRSDCLKRRSGHERALHGHRSLESRRQPGAGGRRDAASRSTRRG